MILDKVDVEIVLNMITSRRPLTSTTLAKLIYNLENKNKIQDYDANIRKKLKKLEKYGILKKTVENGKYVYEISEGSVFIGFKVKDRMIFIKV